MQLFLLGGPGNLIRFPSSPKPPLPSLKRAFMNYLVYKDRVEVRCLFLNTRVYLILRPQTGALAFTDDALVLPL